MSGKAELQPHQARVVEEKIDLDEKIKKLLGFILSDGFQKLQQFEKSDLRDQLQVMLNYSKILEKRILLFGGFN